MTFLKGKALSEGHSLSITCHLQLNAFFSRYLFSSVPPNISTLSAPQRKGRKLILVNSYMSLNRFMCFLFERHLEV